MRIALVAIALVFLATCAQPSNTAVAQVQEYRLPTNWEQFSNHGYILTMPNGCQWIWFSNASYRHAGIEMVPYTGPDGKQVCVEPLQ